MRIIVLFPHLKSDDHNEIISHIKRSKGQMWTHSRKQKG